MINQKRRVLVLACSIVAIVEWLSLAVVGTVKGEKVLRVEMCILSR